MFKGCGLNPQGYIHYTEHLSPICILMEMQLIYCEEAAFKQAERHYPGLNCRFMDWDSFTPEYLASHYDALFSSDYWEKEKLEGTFAPFNKTMRFVHCPHGFSDKAFWLKQVADQDIALIYGPNMLDMLKRENVLDRMNNYVVTGNLRYQYYRMEKEAFDRIVREEVLAKLPSNPRTLLYAPTWMDLENSSSFFDATKFLVETLPPEDNLIVKLHPNIEENDIAGFYRLLGQYENKENVLFLKNFPLIYPLLSASDIYIGDFSSIGYDFLVFDRPMFFLNPTNRNSKTDPGLFLYQAGREITPDEFEKIHSIIEEEIPHDRERHSQKRKEIYAYTFGEEKDWSLLKDEIADACRR